jgi:hypothetical protein
MRIKKGTISGKFFLFLFLSFFFILFCKKSLSPKLLRIFPLNFTEVPSLSVVESDGVTNLFEGVTTDTYTMVLTAKPSKPQTILINFDITQLKINESQISPVVVIFTETNWNVPITISVLANFDNIQEGNIRSKIYHTVKHDNSFYPDVEVNSIFANITDNQGSRLTNSFQSGNITLTAISTSITLASVVNPSKSYVYCNFQLTGSGHERASTCQISSDGTTVLIESGAAGSGTIVNWYVVEFTIGANVQRSSTTLLTTDLTKTITLPTAVDLNRTFIIAYSRTLVTGNANDEQRTVKAKFLNSTSIELARQELGMDIIVEWQTIQLDGARVQYGETTLTSGNTQVDVPLSIAYSNNAFILNTSAGDSNVNGVETDYYLQSNYLNSTNLRFSRIGNSNSVSIAWFAIQMIDGTTVQSGTTAITSSSASATATLSSVNTGKTMILTSAKIGIGSGTSSADQDSGTFSSFFVNAATIQFDRFAGDINAGEISWYTVQFQ